MYKCCCSNIHRKPCISVFTVYLPHSTAHGSPTRPLLNDFREQQKSPSFFLGQKTILPKSRQKSPPCIQTGFPSFGSNLPPEGTALCIHLFIGKPSVQPIVKKNPGNLFFHPCLLSPALPSFDLLPSVFPPPVSLSPNLPAPDLLSPGFQE